tara:strand:+ start:1377 stop:1622 length:246 start_codon:yes stop_codon:yes gene_type:complete
MDNIIVFEDSNFKILEIENIIDKYESLKKSANINYKNPKQELTNIEDPINTSDNVSSIMQNTVKSEILRIYNDFIPILTNI